MGDVARKEDIHRVALQIGAALGGLDVLINNASTSVRLRWRSSPTPSAKTSRRARDQRRRAVPPHQGAARRLAASAREGRGAVVLNISSDAAINAYAQWGAYGASKAALRHMSAIWGEELAAEGVRFLSLDPGDMDTPLHALAVPGADPATLKRPETAAREIADAISAALAMEPA